jgi:hypothetical protein
VKETVVRENLSGRKITTVKWQEDRVNGGWWGGQMALFVVGLEID